MSSETLVESYKLGKAFFEKVWNDEKMKIHSECVIESCINISKNSDLNKDIFIIAGWIHDIGKKLDKNLHHIKSIDFLKDFLIENPQFIKINNEIQDCILNYRTAGKPKTIYGMVFRNRSGV